MTINTIGTNPCGCCWGASCSPSSSARRVGLGSTWFALTRGAASGSRHIGAWTARPKNGTAEIDPYARAALARTGALPVGQGDGVAFTASADDDGQSVFRRQRQ